MIQPSIQTVSVKSIIKAIMIRPSIQVVLHQRQYKYDNITVALLSVIIYSNSQ